MKTDKELQKILNELMPARYYGHEARRNAKRVAEKWAEIKVTQEKVKQL